MTMFDNGSSYDANEASHQIHSGELGSGHSETSIFGGEHTSFDDGSAHSSHIHTPFSTGVEHGSSYRDLLQYDDPLKMVHSMHMEPLELGKSLTHVQSVDPYMHDDGTVVGGHVRGTS